MNKKQLIVTWVISGIISVLFLFPPKFYVISGGQIKDAIMENKWILDKTYWLSEIPLVVDWVQTIFYIFPMLIIGGLLIYTLRDKKK